MKCFIINILLFLFTVGSYSNTFEGTIKIRKNSLYDTTYFSYYIKDNKVRVEEFDKFKSLRQVYLIDIFSKDIYVIKPSEKLYAKLEIPIQSEQNNTNVTIIKSENCKKINGQTCYQWRVKNIEENTEVAYWVVNNEFYFFYDLIKLLPSIDHGFDLYSKIPDSQGFFPVLAVERTLLRKEKCRVEVIDIKSKNISNNLFNIPEGYEIMKR